MNKFFRLGFSCLLGIVGAFSFFSCKDEEESGKKREENIDKFVSSLQLPSQPEIPEQNTDSTYYSSSATEICKVTEYVRGAAFDENFLLDPSTDVIYPGALIDGGSISTGDYSPISKLERAPITVFTDLMNKEGDILQKIENPDGATISQAIKRLMYDCEVNGATCADQIFEVKEIVSRDQLDVELGVTFNAKKAAFSNKFEFGSNTTKHSYLIKYVQRMFSINVKYPGSPSAFFAKSVSASDLSNALSGKMMPCYVGSVSYGRAVYAVMTTEESDSKIADELKGTIDLCVKMETNASASKFSSSSKYSFSGSILGGNADDAAKGIQSIEDIVNFIKSKGNFGKDNPAAMLSYKLNKLSDGSTFAMKKAATYTIKNCETYSGGVVLKSIEARTTEHGGGDGLEPYGDVKVFVGDKNSTIFTLLESQKLSITKGDNLVISNGTIGNKKCSVGESPNLNLHNIEGMLITVDFRDSDPTGNKNDPYFSNPGNKYGEEKNDDFSVKNSQQMKDAIESIKNGEHTAKFYLEVKRVYNKKKYDVHDRDDFYGNPDVVRLHFEINLN